MFDFRLFPEQVYTTVRPVVFLFPEADYGSLPTV